MHFRKEGSAIGSTAITGLFLAILLVVATFRVGVDKNLAGTFTANECGRYLFAMGAALTHLKGGPGGYVVNNVIENKLQMAGLSASPAWLEPLGRKFPDNLLDEALMQHALDAAKGVDVPPAPEGNYSRLRGSHGDDVGLVTFTTLAFQLFGIKISSLYYMYFTLLAATTLLFIAGHGGSRSAMACLALMLLALYVLCLFEIVSPVIQRHPFTGSGGSDIKDPRFFGTLAAIPALHLLVSWLRKGYRPGIWGYVVLAAQALILTLAIHVRWPTLWLLGALLAFLVLALVRRRRTVSHRQSDPAARWQPVLVGGAFASVIGAALIIASSAAHPVYRLDGDLLHHPAWHNAMTALESDADYWNNKYFPAMNGARMDEMPIEIARQGIAALPPDQRKPYLYAHIDHPNPQAVNYFARKRFLQILRDDPWFVAQTFLVLSPAVNMASAAWVYEAPFAGLSVARALTILIAFGVIVWLAAADAEALPMLRSLTFTAGVFSLLAVVPNLLATTPFLMIDHFLWALFFIAAAACWGGVYLVRRLPAVALVAQVSPPDRAMTLFSVEGVIIIACAAALCYETTSIVRSRWNAPTQFYADTDRGHQPVSK